MSRYEYVDTDDLSRLIVILEELPPPRRHSLMTELIDKLIIRAKARNVSKRYHQLMNEAVITVFLESAVRNNDLQVAKNIVYKRVIDDSAIMSSFLRSSMATLLCIETIQLSQSTKPLQFPTFEEVSLNPLLIYYIFKDVFTKKNLRIETHRSLFNGLKEHLFLAYRANQSKTDVVALYVAFLEATGKKSEVILMRHNQYHFLKITVGSKNYIIVR